MAKDDNAFGKFISFVLKPSAAGAEDMKALMKKKGTRVAKTKGRTKRRMPMSKMVGQS